MQTFGRVWSGCLIRTIHLKGCSVHRITSDFKEMLSQGRQPLTSKHYIFTTPSLFSKGCCKPACYTSAFFHVCKLLSQLPCMPALCNSVLCFVRSCPILQTFLLWQHVACDNPAPPYDLQVGTLNSAWFMKMFRVVIRELDFWSVFSYLRLNDTLSVCMYTHTYIERETLGHTRSHFGG